MTRFNYMSVYRTRRILCTRCSLDSLIVIVAYKGALGSFIEFVALGIL